MKIKRGTIFLILFLLVFLLRIIILVSEVSAETSSEYESVIEIENQNKLETENPDIEGSLFSAKPAAAEPNLQQVPNCDWKGKRDGCCSKGECGECKRKCICPETPDNNCKKEIEKYCGTSDINKKTKEIAEKCKNKNYINYRTKNFIIRGGNNPCFFAELFEYYRCRIAVESTGKPLKDWKIPATINYVYYPVPHPYGGNTDHKTDRYGNDIFQINIYLQNLKEEGKESFQNELIPHEIHHMIFDSIFKPGKYYELKIPQWIEEGLSHSNEQSRESKCSWFKEFNKLLNNKNPLEPKFIPLKQLITEPQPLIEKGYRRFAEGYSLTGFLLKQAGSGCKGKRKLYKTFEEVLKNGNTIQSWESALKNNYGFNSLDELEKAWLDDFNNNQLGPGDTIDEKIKSGCNPCTCTEESENQQQPNLTPTPAPETPTPSPAPPTPQPQPSQEPPKKSQIDRNRLKDLLKSTPYVPPKDLPFYKKWAVNGKNVYEAMMLDPNYAKIINKHLSDSTTSDEEFIADAHNAVERKMEGYVKELPVKNRNRQYIKQMIQYKIEEFRRNHPHIINEFGSIFSLSDDEKNQMHERILKKYNIN